MSRRREMDVMKLMMAGYDVEVNEEENAKSESFSLVASINGPKDSPYEGGVFRLSLSLPKNYPFSSPSVGFLTPTFHPNIDFRSGSVCLDVLNSTWSAIYGLDHILETFIPHLLRYPNPSDPLYQEAAALLLKDPEKYNERVRECVKKYAGGTGLPSKPETKKLDTSDGSRGRASTADTARTASFSSTDADGASASDGVSPVSAVAVDDDDDDDDDVEGEDGESDVDDDDDDDDSVCSDLSEMSDL